MTEQHTPLTILLVDDHAVVRTGYRALLEGVPDLQLVAEADHGEAAVKAFMTHNPDVVVMDLSLPGIGGIEAIRRILQRQPEARILAFSMHEDTVYIEQALQAGARGYVTKSSAPTVLIEAVRQVAAGGVYLEPELAQRLAFQKTRGADAPLSSLTTREFQIFCLLAAGETANDIARRLSLSAKTIANHTTQLKAKLAVQSLAELARLGIRHGLVTV